MPKYVYYCEECEKEFGVKHSLQEVVEICQLCNVSANIVRRPSTIFLSKKDDNLEAKIKPGSIVKEVIEESRQDLKVEQEKLAKREHNK
jgi:hypothetical protein